MIKTAHHNPSSAWRTFSRILMFTGLGTALFVLGGVPSHFFAHASSNLSHLLLSEGLGLSLLSLSILPLSHRKTAPLASIGLGAFLGWSAMNWWQFAQLLHLLPHLTHLPLKIMAACVMGTSGFCSALLVPYLLGVQQAVHQAHLDP